MRYFALVPLTVLVMFAGCGGPSLHTVQGTVSVDGKPLDTGSVAFHPAGSKGDVEQVIGRSQIDSSGKYRLYTDGKDGIPAGSYKVVVIAQPPLDSSKPNVQPPSLVDKKFTQLDTTPLTVEVPSSSDKYNLSITK